MRNEDYLIYRFTAYITKVIQFARKDYLKKLKWKEHEVSLDFATLENLMYIDNPFQDQQKTFEFESVKMAAAFKTLSDLRKRVLELTFIQELNASEIADILNCSVEYVYQERYRAIKKLKALIERMRENDE